MDPDLYKATKNGDADKFIDALEEVSELRRLALSQIFDQVTPSGNSLLHVAASSGKGDVIELILDHFPHLATQKNSTENTPLHVAVQDKIFNATEMVIERVTDLEIMYWQNKDGKSPLYLAAETGDLKILRLLLKHSARDEAYTVKTQGMSPVLAALEPGKSGILKEIVDQLPKLLRMRDENGGTPLHTAASIGNVEAVRFLLSKCSYLALQTDENGSYPIHIACESGHVDTIRVLVEMWPDLVEIKNKEGQNILHVAAKAGNNKVVRYILECSNPDIKKLVNSKDVNGNTPLHLASMHNHCEVMRSLTKEKGIDLRLRNNDGLTALDVAMEFRSLSTINSALLGRAILIGAGVPQSEGQNILSRTEHIAGPSKACRPEWMRDQINTRLLVATLVASVTFTAGFTLPGGYNASNDRDPGTATMLQSRTFQLFVIFDTLAMYSSILAVVVLLGSHVDDFYRAEQAYRKAGPLLLMAVTGMTVAFSAAIVVEVSKLTCLVNLVMCIGVPYIAMLIMYLLSIIFPISRTVMFLQSLY
ncbi:hypothetical protein EUGRSUZ_K00998 [Eucalyptus grandis]|uniref:Uncharacterized protein n=2 Tax=Eucalyptus grandis TaxID=71139 RepID=A0ACC3ITL6_EUCGR|nr:hypothetical protein EUGRSUZ_K00998 [Eucalyptus grandis]